jgi:hypothetical protein
MEYEQPLKDSATRKSWAGIESWDELYSTVSGQAGTEISVDFAAVVKR